MARRHSLAFRVTSALTALLTFHFLCGQQLAQAAGLAGIAVTVAVAGLVARWRFAADVTV